MALSTSRTVVTNTGLSTHDHFRVRDLISVGVATFSNFKTGSTNVHSVGVEAAGINVFGGDTPIGAGATIYDDGGARFSGVVTATSFHGDISQATGAAAGLGTALSQTQTDPLNKVYYTNKVLSISTTTTIDHPATANLAYTQYGDIKIEDGHDLIIKTDDDFKYDILGISTTKIPSNQFPSGLSGDLTGNVTGSGANLTNIPAGQLTGALPAISGANLTGIIAGITEFDQWYLTANLTSTGDITSNLARNNFSGSAVPIGTGMSESSGIFSFPRTGKYFIVVTAEFNLNGYDNIYVNTHVTLNNGGAYTVPVRAMDGNNGTNTRAGSGTSFYLLDVTDISNVKVKFSGNSIGSGSNIVGSTNMINTTFIFIRLGDT